ncbi:MAG: cupin domain-containing protein [Planctomycetota bacterium]
MPADLDADAIIELLDLKPLPLEGGYYRETFRSPLVLIEESLPMEYEGNRNASTAIYFLLTPDENSAMHILPTDEVFHFYLGDAVEMLRLAPDGSTDVTIMGTDLLAGERPQVVVPGGVWQGCRLVEGGRFALLGCTVAPGFDFRDFHIANAAEMLDLIDHYAEQAPLIRHLAPSTAP